MTDPFPPPEPDPATALPCPCLVDGKPCGSWKRLPKPRQTTTYEHRPKHMKFKKKHGMWRTRVHNIWTHMKRRCLNPTSPSWPKYGGRGITVCERWHKFENFFSDMGMPTTDNHSLDRIDNGGNYEPRNCRWATPKEQSRNSRINTVITIKGVSHCLQEWAEIYGHSKSLISSRIYRGWNPALAVTTPKITNHGNH